MSSAQWGPFYYNLNVLSTICQTCDKEVQLKQKPLTWKKKKQIHEKQC